MRVKVTRAQLAAMAKGKPPPAPSEASIQKAVIALFEARGCLVVRINGGLLPRADGGRMRCNTASVGTCTDLVVLMPGGHAAVVEVKRPGGPLTPGQAAFIDAARARGHQGCVVRSVADAEAVLAAVAGEGT